MTAAEEAIRRAVPKLEALATFASGVYDSRSADSARLALLHVQAELGIHAADLLSALDGSEGASGPTTAQEGSPQSNESREETAQT